MHDLDDFNPAATAEQRKLENMNRRAEELSKSERPIRILWKTLAGFLFFFLGLIVATYIIFVFKPEPLYGHLDVMLRSIGI